MSDALNDELFKLDKIHIDHNGFGTLMKHLPREKLEFCCFAAKMTNFSAK